MNLKQLIICLFLLFDIFINKLFLGLNNPF